MASILDNQWRNLKKVNIGNVCAEVRDTLVRYHGTANVATVYNPSKGENERVIHIGTDAQKHGRKTDFATAVCILNPGHGATAFYTQGKQPHVNSLQHKLFTEVGLSIEIALALCEFGLNAEGISVHIDANTNLKWESAPFHQRLAGMVMANGFNAVLKPDAWAASHVADHAVKHKNEPSKQNRRVLRRRGKGNRK